MRGKIFSFRPLNFDPKMNCIVEGLFLLTDPAILPKNELNNRGAFSDCQKGGEKPEKQDTGHGL